MKRFFKKHTPTTFLFTLIVFIPSVSFAQMFSVEDSDPFQARPLNIYTMVGVSWDFADFSFRGDGLAEGERLDFNEGIFRIQMKSPGLNLSLGFGGSLTGMDNHSYLNASGRLFNDLSLIRETKFQLRLPIQITTDLMRINGDNTDIEFQQSSFTIGSGIASALRFGERTDLILRATPNYGFSFSPGALFGGSLFRFDGGGFILIANVFGTTGLSFGYDFDYRVYNLDGETSDYNYTSHSITIGITF